MKQKRNLRIFLIICLSSLLVLGFAVISQAATTSTYTPGKVAKPTVTVMESALKLTWKKVSKATGYIVYRVDTKTKKLTRIRATTKTTYTVKNLKNNTKYTFCVMAYNKVNSKRYDGKVSTYVTGTPKITRPAAPTVTLNNFTSTSATLSWKAVSGATSYKVYQRKASSSTYTLVGTTKKTGVVINNLKSGTSYYFKVRSVRTVDGVSRDGYYSKAVYGMSYKEFHSMEYAATVTSTVKASLTDKSGTVTVAAGTKVTVTSRSSGDNTVRLSDGREVIISGSYLTYTSCLTTNTVYAAGQVENFVNKKGYASYTQYLIWISLTNQRCYLLRGSKGNWTLYKECRISSGTVNAYTEPGIFQLWKKEERAYFDAYSYADMACFFNWNAMHTWVYYIGTGTPVPDGQYGSVASHGCVRLENDMITYIYNVVPLYTTVVVY